MAVNFCSFLATKPQQEGFHKPRKVASSVVSSNGYFVFLIGKRVAQSRMILSFGSSKDVSLTTPAWPTWHWQRRPKKPTTCWMMR